MAHAGKVHPLHFRRDIWILGQRNQTAMKKAYMIRWLNLTGDLATAPIGEYVRCDAVDEATAYPLEWKSEWTAVAGRSIRLGMRAGVDMARPFPQWAELFVEDSSAGLVIRFGSSMTSQFDSQSWLTDNLLENPEPDLLRKTTFGGAMNIRAVKWDGSI